LFGRQVGVIRARHPFEQDCKLVTSQASGSVAFAKCAAESLGNCAQEIIAGCVPEAVVDELEIVKIHEEHRAIGVRPAVARARVTRPSKSALLGSPVSSSWNA
jgi:hypothetical protein